MGGWGGFGDRDGWGGRGDWGGWGGRGGRGGWVGLVGLEEKANGHPPKKIEKKTITLVQLNQPGW